MKPRIIAITGTPATGKTAVAKALAKMMGANLIQLSDITKKMKAPSDKSRNVKIIPIGGLQKAVNNHLKNGVNIIEGHLSHHLASNLIIVLRCNPAELAKRMQKKGWSRAKIRENVETELIGIIAGEASAKGHSIEIDTTGRSPGAIAKNALSLIKSPRNQKPVNWLRPQIILKLGRVLCG